MSADRDVLLSYIADLRDGAEHVSNLAQSAVLAVESGSLDLAATWLRHAEDSASRMKGRHKQAFAAALRLTRGDEPTKTEVARD